MESMGDKIHLDGCSCIMDEDKWQRTHDAEVAYNAGLRLTLIAS